MTKTERVNLALMKGRSFNRFEKEAAHPTDQDKESGLQTNGLDITDSANISQFSPQI